MTTGDGVMAWPDGICRCYCNASVAGVINFLSSCVAHLPEHRAARAYSTNATCNGIIRETKTNSLGLGVRRRPVAVSVVCGAKAQGAHADDVIEYNLAEKF